MDTEISSILNNFEIGFLEDSTKYLDSNKLLILTVYNDILEINPLIKPEDILTFERHIIKKDYIEIKKDIYKIILSDSIFIFKAYIDSVVKVYIGYLVEKNNINRLLVINNQIEMQNKYMSL